MIHGRQDNAGSFDLLIPKLPESYYYICIDLPSHGKSSHFPPNTPINITQFVVAVTYVINYFKWQKITIIAHSLGARVACHVALTYPRIIERLVFLDSISMYPVHPGDFGDITRENIEKFIKMTEKLQKNSPPEYTADEALDRIMENRPTAICKEGALNMLNRALIPLENGRFHLSMDQRLKFIFFDLLSSENVAEVIKYCRFKFPHLVLLASETNNLLFNKSSEPILRELKKNQNCRIIIVNGNHDVHNNNADLVARYINIFLEKYPTPEYYKKSKKLIQAKI